jgi:hypothetical protein
MYFGGGAVSTPFVSNSVQLSILEVTSRIACTDLEVREPVSETCIGIFRWGTGLLKVRAECVAYSVGKALLTITERHYIDKSATFIR